MVSSEEELWVDVVGYQGIYLVSNMGRVKALPKSLLDHTGRVRNYGEIILKQQTVNKYGHLKVGLTKDSQCKEFLVHRLVLMAFCRLPEDKEEALHQDGNPQNNRFDNLRWGSSKENSDDCFAHGTLAKGVDLPQHKLTEDQVISIRADNRTSKLIADDYNMSARHIRAIKERRYWKHI